MNSGVYILEISARESFKVGIKKFRNKIFDAGYYYYVGSAQKNLRQRLRRHIRKDKLIHWHIDHITVRPDCKIGNIFVLFGADKNMEENIANLLSLKFKLDSSIIGFGNSDSPNSKTHLFFSNVKIDYDHLISLYQSMVRLIPSEIDTF